MKASDWVGLGDGEWTCVTLHEWPVSTAPPAASGTGSSGDQSSWIDAGEDLPESLDAEPGAHQPAISGDQPAAGGEFAVLHEAARDDSDASSGICTEFGMGGESSAEERMALDEFEHMRAESDMCIYCPTCHMWCRGGQWGEHLATKKHRKLLALYERHGYGKLGGSCGSGCPGCSKCKSQGGSGSSK